MKLPTKLVLFTSKRTKTEANLNQESLQTVRRHLNANKFMYR